MTDNPETERQEDQDMIPSAEEALTSQTAQPVKPKKKKKKKKANNPSVKAFKDPAHKVSDNPLEASNSSEEVPDTTGENSSSEELPATPTTILSLPVKPDEWFVTPATHDEEGNIVTEQTFVFLHNGIEVINMPLTEANFTGLTTFLNERFPSEDTNADYFHIRKPMLGSDEAHPVMTLTQNNRILATTVLDQKTLKKLIRALQSHIIQTSPVSAWLKRWWGKHKVLRVFVVIAAIPSALLLIYTGFWGMTH